MALKYYGRNTEANPRYQAAVRAQQAKERARLAAQAQVEHRHTETQKREHGPTATVEDRIVLERAVRVMQLAISEKQPEAKEIIQAVATLHKVDVADIIGTSSFQNVIDARHKAIVLIRNNYREMSLRQIGLFFNRDHTTIRNALHKAGFKTNTRRFIDRSEAIRLVNEGFTHKQIAAQMGFSLETVTKATLSTSKRELSPERRAQLEEAVKLRAQGLSYVKVAEILGVNRATLQRDFVKGGAA